MEKNTVSFEFGHIGINAADDVEACKIADLFFHLFGFLIKEEPTAKYCGAQIEILKKSGIGLHGHIGILTNDIPEAVKILQNKGFTFKPENCKRDDNGNILAVYMDQMIGGFAIHLSKKHK